MIGTLVLTGELNVLAEVAHRLQAEYPAGLHVEVTSMEHKGYTVERAKTLLARLAPKQHAALKLLVDAGGQVGQEELRASFGNENGQIKGLTGPISKHVKNLIAEGVFPEGTEPPTNTDYDPMVRSYQRAGGMHMDAEHVVIFRLAFEQ